MRIGMVGLGRMGMNMTRRLIQGGHEVVAHARREEQVRQAGQEGAVGAYSLAEVAEKLPTPRVVWIMVPAGRAVNDTIEGIKPHLIEGDTIIDGGNTFYGEDIVRAEALKEIGVNYLDVGTSGGIWGLEKGYCLMVGGERKVFESVEPVLETLAPPDGYLYCGPSGAGHFVKMVHNGIEYGMMQSYAEGFDLMNSSRYSKDLDLSKLAHLWNQGSVIRSWLLELLGGAFEKEQGLESVKGYVQDSGEGRWMVEEAVERGVPLPAITAALFARFASRCDDSFANKVLAILRAEFGGHEVKTKE